MHSKSVVYVLLNQILCRYSDFLKKNSWTIACHKCCLLSIMQVDNTYYTIYHTHACITSPWETSMILWKISMYTTFLTSYHYRPFTFHYQTSKHYQRNNIPVFESIRSMLNLLKCKNKALLSNTFQTLICKTNTHTHWR